MDIVKQTHRGYKYSLMLGVCSIYTAMSSFYPHSTLELKQTWLVSAPKPFPQDDFILLL